MKKIAKIYDALAADYERLLEQANSKNSHIAFATYDFFSPEPFYHEINNVLSDGARFYASQDELPEDADETHLCALADRRLIFTRNYFGSDVYYDSFFIYADNEKYRYQVYVNNGQIKPIMVEHLLLNADNSPCDYKKYSEHGYQHYQYRHFDGKSEAERNFYDTKASLLFRDKLDIVYTDDKRRVSRIDQITDKRIKTLYDINARNSTVDALLQQAKKHIIDTVLTWLEHQTRIEEQVVCMLFEYCMQGPFPPSLLLVWAAKERRPWRKGGIRCFFTMPRI